MVISEIILNGILHLFAALSSNYSTSEQAKARDLVEHYLSDYLGIVNYEPYLGLFDGFLDFHDDIADEKALVALVIEICDNLKGHIPRSEQYTVLLRFFELTHVFQTTSDDVLPLLAEAAGESFAIDDTVMEDILAFLYTTEESDQLGPNLLFARPEKPLHKTDCKWLFLDHFCGGFTVLHIEDIDTIFLAPHKNEKLTVNNIPLQTGGFCILPQGAIVRDVNSLPVYYTDIITAIKPFNAHTAIQFTAENVDFRFPKSDNGLHDLSFNAAGGEMIGVMGGSGVGKSTLIGILNGSMVPQKGQLLINGLDLYNDKNLLEGVIGFVPQDDLLFDELTVYENLLYSSRLCLADLSNNDLNEKVCCILDELNQLDTKDLTVGSPLEKTISGGQRKRLNIALELIREPSVLFVDEPTSGLSSADSLNVINLLKAQSNKGKLIIVIIHQPSSDIFKMFDKLWILDKGGRPIYTGNPIDAVVYFRNAVQQAGTDDCLCPQCGNVNSEQIFDIIEMRKLDEHGYSTIDRLFTPDDWHARHLAAREVEPPVLPDVMVTPPKALQRPSLTGQFLIFLTRNFLSRLANKQYLSINIFEAPFLAWIIANIAKFEGINGYLFSENHNIPVYFFMSVIVALFMGLSVSAEEIIRDRKILSRERFLHLSWFSYINAKVIYLCIVSAIQMGLYVLVGNFILQIPEFSFHLWLILFSCSVCASIIGLNISATFKTVVTIYILIPLLLVPQIIIGGLVVTFDDLTPAYTPHNRVPIIGNIMPSRWGFEAAVVEYVAENRFQAPYNDFEEKISRADYMVNNYVTELRSHIDYPFLKVNDPKRDSKIQKSLLLLKNEFQLLEENENVTIQLPPDAFEAEKYSRSTAKKLKAGLSELTTKYRIERNNASDSRKKIETERIAEIGETTYWALEKQFQNKSLTDLVKNRDNLDNYRVTENNIVRVSDPIYTSDLVPWGGAPFYARKKQLGTLMIPTYQFNLTVLWFASGILYLCLYLNILNRLLHSFETTTRYFKKHFSH